MILNQHRYTLILLLICITCWLPNPSGAQLSNSLSGSNQENPIRPSSTGADFFELLESGGNLLVNYFRPEESAPTLENPNWNSTTSPRHTVFTFLEAMNHIEFGREKAWPRVEKTLALPKNSDLSTREIANDLKDIFDRLNEISPGSIPGKEQIEQSQITRYELFPYGIDHEWIWKFLNQAPKGSIVLKKTKEGNWVFDEQTIQNVAQLAESLTPIPPRSRKQQHGELFIDTFKPFVTQTPWWAWLTLLSGIVLGVLLSWGTIRILDYLSNVCYERKWYRIGLGVKGLSFPLAFLFVALGIIFGSASVELGLVLQRLRWNIVEFLLVIACGWLVVELIDLLLLSSYRLLAKHDDKYIHMSTLILRRSVRLFVAVILAIFLLQNMLQVNITAILGGLGLVALAISLAAQDAFKNLFGAVMVFANRPFMIGDWIQFRDQIGEVEDISIQVTRMRLLSGELWTVPNMHFTDEPVENFSHRFYILREMDIQIPYTMTKDKIVQAMELLDEILRSDEIVNEGKYNLELHPPIISFNQIDVHSYNIKIYYWYYMSEGGRQPQRNTDRGWFTYLEHCSMVNQKIVERFNQEDIEFVFPSQTLYLANDPKQELTVQTHLVNQEA